MSTHTVQTLETFQGGVASPKGFTASGQYVGIKAAGRGLDLALIVSDRPATAAFWGAIQLVWSGYLGEIDRHLYLAELTQFILAGLIYQDRRLGTLSPTLGTVA